MGYKKVLIDNPLCSRRFHVTFDPDSAAVPQVELKCSYCGVSIFKEANHPQAILAREENLVKTAEFSDQLVRECQFRDHFSGGPNSELLYPKR